MESCGKWVTVVPAHALTAVVLAPLAWIYDFAMSFFLFIACVFTCGTIDEINEAYLRHTSGLLTIPYEIFRHVIAACIPPCSYSCL